MPDTKRLCCGPAVFGMTQDPEESSADLKEIFYFIGNYVAKSEGIMRITKIFKENKGWNYVKNIMNVDQLTYAACSVDNHEPVWWHDAMIQGLEDEVEKKKYKNYKDLDPEERVKYARKETR